MIAAHVELAEGYKLAVRETPMPVAGPNEILVRVAAAGVTPTELIWYPTTHTREGGVRQNAIPGHEFSGTVETVGSEVQGFLPGDEVYGINDWFQEGATAEFCITSPTTIARKPRTLSQTEAATVPIGALTAWQGLFDHGKLQGGERVLIHGGAGSVGAFAIQLARLHGAEVVATASGRSMEFVRSLGADKVIDYKAARFESSVSMVDVVLDGVGGDTLQRSWQLLKPGGRAVTVAANGESTMDRRVKDAFFIVEGNQQQLVEVGGLLDKGALQTSVGATVPLSQASAAYEGRVSRPDGYGKVVVVMPEQRS